MVGPEADLAGMRKKIEELARHWYHEPVVAGRVRFRVTVTKTMMDLLSVARQYGVLVDREMIKYIRSTILADGLVSRLAPGFDLAAVLRRVVEDYLAAEPRARFFEGRRALAAGGPDYLDAVRTGRSDARPEPRRSPAVSRSSRRRCDA